jgi:high affinity Mn2+ porin
MSHRANALFSGAILIFTLALPVLAQDTSNDNTSIFPHSDTSRVYIAGQMNFIHQQNPSFPAKYSGENSFQAEREKATSRLMTLYTGLEVGHSTELLVDIESAGGQGLSSALGLAGFTNLDVVRNPTLGSKPYLARLMLHYTIPLGEEMVTSERTFLSLATERPERRLEFRVGKMSIADFFDVNAVASDSHLQFMNWTVDNNGGYDYAADTRGYTYAGVAEYHSRNWSTRFGEALMPKVANGINLDWDLRRARAENIEVELRPPLVRDHRTTLRLLSYVNHANMGSYREAIDAFLDGRDPRPDIEAHRRQGRVKYGFGFNAEQEVVNGVRAFARAGWNEGHNESFAYTEVNGTLAVGGDVAGKTWHRANDKFGVALVHNSISGDHRRYLQLGGNGFLLGDGITFPIPDTTAIAAL